MLDPGVLRILGLSEDATAEDIGALTRLPSLGYCSELAATLLDAVDSPIKVFADLACGPGAALVDVSCRYGSRCVGIDICLPLLREARRRTQAAGVQSKVSLIQADLRRPLPIVLHRAQVICLSAVGDLFGSTEETLRLLASLTVPSQLLLWMESHAWPQDEADANLGLMISRLGMLMRQAGWVTVGQQSVAHKISLIPDNRLGGNDLRGITSALLACRASNQRHDSKLECHGE